MATIEFKGISKSFGSVSVLKNIDFSVEDGSFLILLGPSGCGKTTLLRLLAGLDEPTSGEIWIDGKNVTSLPPKNRDIAMVFQSYALYPHMTVEENMAFSLKMRKVSKDEIKKRVDEAAQILEIGPLLKRRPKALSGGQRQRVALGRALVRKPKVFLMDEPLSNLDAKLRAHMRRELANLHKRLGTTIVYVTHDQVEAMTMGTKVVLSNKGEIHQIGKPSELYDKPQTSFVADFIGSPAMNLFEGHISFESGKRVFVKGNTKLPLGNLELPEAVELQMGIRPENIGLEETGHSIAIDAVVQNLEFLGSETLFQLEWAGSKFVVKCAGNPARNLGEKLKVYFPYEKLHFFEASGARIDLSGSDSIRSD